MTDFKTHSEIFGDSKWISASDTELCPIIKKEFSLQGFTKATIDIIGFASFNFYVNGARGSEDLFLPLASDFEYRGVPKDEITAHRCYVSHYDITSLLREGNNCLCVMLGDGWYTGHTGKYKEVPYGEKKLCFKITVKNDESEYFIYSDTDAKWTDSYLKSSDLNFGEEQDHLGFSEEILLGGGDDDIWHPTKYAKAPDTRYCYTDCPADRVVEIITPTVVRSIDGDVIYDAGKNITGFPTLITEGYTGEVEVLYSEDLNESGDLLEKCTHSQRTSYKVYGERTLLEPAFTWLGFRYFKVKGDAKVLCVKRINCDIKINSHFECDDENLNWLYKAFVLTELSNMHQGIPSDCPHIERRGYLGDGHLTCFPAMLTLDAKAFYKKWIADISDCQDRLSGHAQYTAPYTHSGGGPGGFAHGFIKIPYQYYLHYGDDTPLKEMYGQFLEYFRYLEDHSEFDLVVSDKDGEWCLGEWCVPREPTGDMLSLSDAKPGGSFLTPAYVNTVYYVKSMELFKNIASILGKDEDIQLIDERIKRKKAAIKAAFFNPNNGTFLGNMQGGNAFALDIGLGDERTKEGFIAYYEKNPCFDTGIFGTEIVSRLLCKYGRVDILRKMIGAKAPRGFGKWRESGATTLWEYWDAPRSRSHPMFGSPTSLLFEYILGIKQEPDSAGYRSLIIEPSLSAGLDHARGYITSELGKIEVSYKKENEEFILSVSIPDGARATVKLGDKELQIEGEKRCEVKYLCK